jgi:uncharacterized protein YndB with AHSA1/START domain
VVLERTYDASAAEIWEMWTTPNGIEAWWGPDGFRVVVHAIDVAPGGHLVYTMEAIGPEQIEHVKGAGMPVATTHDVTFTDVVPYRRLSYSTAVDFIPGVAPYTAETRVVLAPIAAGTRLTLTLDAMHDEHWTGLAVAGWESELDRLRRALLNRKEET